jgi:glycosyltransferase involved in cell wall biosynthesis
MISVIVPAYNSEKTIGECLEALEKQTKKPDEIIVVDDGSNDKTRNVVKKFSKVRLIEQGHRGPASARNLGAKNAKGEILLFMDADCKADREWVSEMTRPFSDKEISGVQGRYKTAQKGLVARFVQLEIEDRYDRMRKRKYIDFVGSYSAGYRRSVFLEFGGFDESFRMASGEDPDISFKISKAGHKIIFSENAVVYHNHVNSLPAYLKQKFWRAYWRVLLYRKHPGKAVEDSYTPQALKFQILCLLCMAFSAFASLVYPQLIFGIPAFLLVLFAFTLPLTFKNFRKDKAVGISTPFISILRTIIFAFGMAYGALKL